MRSKVPLVTLKCLRFPLVMNVPDIVSPLTVAMMATAQALPAGRSVMGTSSLSIFPLNAPEALSSRGLEVSTELFPVPSD